MGSEMCIRDSIQGVELNDNDLLSAEIIETTIFTIFEDLNTSKTLSVLSELLPLRNKNKLELNSPTGLAVVKTEVANFIKTAKLLGLLQKDPEAWFKGGLDYDALVAEYDSVRAQALAAKEAGDKAKMGEMFKRSDEIRDQFKACLLYTSPSPRDATLSRMPSSA